MAGGGRSVTSECEIENQIAKNACPIVASSARWMNNYRLYRTWPLAKRVRDALASGALCSELIRRMHRTEIPVVFFNCSRGVGHK